MWFLGKKIPCKQVAPKNPRKKNRYTFCLMKFDKLIFDWIACRLATCHQFSQFIKLIGNFIISSLSNTNLDSNFLKISFFNFAAEFSVTLKNTLSLFYEEQFCRTNFAENYLELFKVIHVNLICRLFSIFLDFFLGFFELIFSDCLSLWWNLRFEGFW